MHHNFDDSDSGYDVDMEHKSKNSFGIGGYRGRIIFLGDGTEVLTDTDDTEMLDNSSEEDKDLASQVSKTTPEKEGSEEESETPTAPDAQAGPAAEPDRTGTMSPSVPTKLPSDRLDPPKHEDVKPDAEAAGSSAEGEEKK